MNSTLESELYTYLGELMHKYENTFDWIERSQVARKLNAVYILLGIDKVEKSELEKLIEILKNERDN